MFFGRFISKSDQEVTGSVCPYRSLCIAMVESALLDSAAKEKHLRVSAVNFILTHSEEPFSFDWLCEEAGVCGMRIKREISRRTGIPMPIKEDA